MGSIEIYDSGLLHSNNSMFEGIRHVKSIPIFLNHKIDIPLITILIPTYKRADLLKETLESAINQKTSISYEIIVGDNNPCDDETSLLMSGYQNNANISYYKHSQNIGMSGNWNRLFQLSRSKWSVLLHDDDILSPYYIETIFKYLDDETLLIKPIIPKFYSDCCFDFNEPVNVTVECLSLEAFLWGCPLGSPSHMIFKTDWVINSGGFDESVFPCMDYLFNLKSALNGRVIKINCVLGGYRVSRNESLNHSVMEKYWKSRAAISGMLFREYGFPKMLITITEYLCFSFYVDGINKRFKCTYTPQDFSYIIPKSLQSLLIRSSVFIARRSKKLIVKYLK